MPPRACSEGSTDRSGTAEPAGPQRTSAFDGADVAERRHRVVRNQLSFGCGYVACAEGFDAVAAVLDAASVRFRQVLGEARGRHARTAVPVTRLPLGAAVERVLSFATT